MKFRRETKGGEKVRPYLEVKVVKVKKEKKEIVGEICIKGMYYPIYENKHNRIYFESKKKIGNWVNGENLDKIKFPCFCSYSDGEGSERKKGLFSMNSGYYYIADIENQKREQEDVSQKCDNLKDFVRFNNIHILKGKIIIWEEE